MTALANVDPLPRHGVIRPEDIAALPREQRGQIITRALEESKAWLAVATKGTDPTPITEFKAWAATVAEMTRQKGLAEDIQFDALEMVRRAERAVGLAVRAGQSAGVIAAAGYSGPPRKTEYTRTRLGQTETCRLSAVRDANSCLTSPREFLPHGGELSSTYAVTDGISDEEFEQALAEARVEGNLSRANLVRKCRLFTAKPDPTPEPPSPAPEPAPAVRLTRVQKAAKIRELAAADYTSKQMVKPLATLDSTIREIAREYGIDIPADRVTARLRRLDPVRIVRETVFALEGLCQGLRHLTPEDLDQLPPDLVEEWLNSLPDSLRTLQQLAKDLKSRVRF